MGAGRRVCVAPLPFRVAAYERRAPINFAQERAQSWGHFRASSVFQTQRRVSILGMSHRRHFCTFAIRSNYAPIYLDRRWRPPNQTHERPPHTHLPTHHPLTESADCEKCPNMDDRLYPWGGRQAHAYSSTRARLAPPKYISPGAILRGRRNPTRRSFAAALSVAASGMGNSWGRTWPWATTCDNRNA